MFKAFCSSLLLPLFFTISACGNNQSFVECASDDLRCRCKNLEECNNEPPSCSPEETCSPQTSEAPPTRNSEEEAATSTDEEIDTDRTTERHTEIIIDSNSEIFTDTDIQTSPPPDSETDFHTDPVINATTDTHTTLEITTEVHSNSSSVEHDTLVPSTDTFDIFNSDTNIETHTNDTDRDVSDAGVDTSEPEYVKPELIISGMDDYWFESTLTFVESDQTAVTLRVDDSTIHQRWDGFGGTFCERGWEVLQVLDASERERAIQLLFDPQKGAGFTQGRIPIGANDYAIDRYTLHETPGDFSMSDFSIERDRRFLIPYVRAAFRYQPNLRLWASAWTPPPWMKTNYDYDKGSLQTSPLVLDAYALYLFRYVDAYHSEEGIEVDAIHVQNEPSYVETYPSCEWTPELMRDFVQDHLGPLFESESISHKIWLGTLSDKDDDSYVNTLMGEPAAASYINGFGVQWNTLDFLPNLTRDFPNHPIIQTEHRCGNYPWDSDFNPDMAPNDHAYAEHSFDMILDYIKAGVNGYMAWNMVLDEVGKNIDSDRPWPQNTLLVVNQQSKALIVTPAYYVFRHFSNFIDVGAQRISITGAEMAVAFKNPDDNIVVVLANTSHEQKLYRILIQDRVVEVEIPARGWATLNVTPN